MEHWVQVLVFKDGHHSAGLVPEPGRVMRDYDGEVWKTILDLPELVVIEPVAKPNRYSLWVTSLCPCHDQRRHY